MNQVQKKFAFVIAFLLILSGCNPATLKYQLDPDIESLNILPDTIKIVAVKVTDLREDADLTSKQLPVLGPNDEAKVLQEKLTALLKQRGYKIISKPLLADLAFNLEIKTLALTIEELTFKSIIKGKSEIKITVNKHSEQWSKIFRATSMQEVANPINNLDVTGVINKMLTKQFSEAFSDTALEEFIKKNQ